LVKLPAVLCFIKRSRNVHKTLQRDHVSAVKTGNKTNEQYSIALEGQ